MYAVARRALIAGDDDGKRISNNRVVREAEVGTPLALCSDSCCTISHCYWQVSFQSKVTILQKRGKDTWSFSSI